MIHTNTIQEYCKLYKGKHFRYRSKYGGTVENIICKDVSTHEKISISKEGIEITNVEIFLISDRGNAYSIKEIEFYN